MKRSVGVVGGPDRGVAEALGDHVGILSFGDEESHVGVSQIVGPHGTADRRFDGWVPKAPPPSVHADRPAFGGREDSAVVSGVGRQMMGQLLCQERWEADGPPRGPSLERLLYAELATEEVQPINAE